MVRCARRRRPAHPPARSCAASTATATSAPRPPGATPRDPNRRGGITTDTVNDIIKAAARAADLTPTPTPEELTAAAQTKQEAVAAADAAPTAEEANVIVKTWRTAKRAARAAVRRITGHRFRRRPIQAMPAAGNPPEVVAVYSRHSPRSSAFDAHRNNQIA
ncbi:hypothetical protein WEB32_34105 [Streptomyces netropsis]|uniref:hypothetical protein n=1 Tax=Streptomyces netropsis TaxID=55404 RepID=UPI0030D24AD7